MVFNVFVCVAHYCAAPFIRRRHRDGYWISGMLYFIIPLRPVRKADGLVFYSARFECLLQFSIILIFLFQIFEPRGCLYEITAFPLGRASGPIRNIFSDWPWPPSCSSHSNSPFNVVSANRIGSLLITRRTQPPLCSSRWRRWLRLTAALIFNWIYSPDQFVISN